jgi:hypothetical protein
MRSKSRTVLAIAIAVAALGAAGSASASAASWWVAGSPLTEAGQTAKLTTKTKIDEAFVLTTWGGMEIECSNVKAVRSEIVGPNVLQATALKFAGCSVTEGNGTCQLEGKTIETVPLKVTASLGSTKPNDTLVFKPEKGEKLFSFAYHSTGEECALEGTHEVKGKITTTAPTGQEELAEQEVVFDTSVGALEIKEGVSSDGLKGKAKLKLESGQAWSFH